MPRDISIVLKGNYTDREVKKAIRDLQTLQTQAPKTGKSFQLMSTSFKGFALGVGAGAVLGGAARGLVDMGQAAADDQKSVVALGKAMQNVGMGDQARQAEDYVKQLMLATGIADEDLRPAFQKLATATGDVAKAQRLMNLAVDVSAAGYGDLTSISKALSSAAMGNFNALQRLKLPLDANIIKAKDLDGAVASLTKTVGGQAAAAADTYAGKLLRVQTAAAEASETVGYSLLGTLDKLSDAFGGTNGVVGGITAAGDQLAIFVHGLGDAALAAQSFMDTTYDGKKATDAQTAGLGDLIKKAYEWNPVTGLLVQGTEQFIDASKASYYAEQNLNDEIARSIQMRHIYADASKLTETGMDAEARAAAKATAALKLLNDVYDKRAGLNRSIYSQRTALADTKAKGPDAGKDKVLSQRERRDFAVKVAEQASGLAQTYIDKGQLVKARNVLDANRRYVTGVAGEKFAGSVVDSSKDLNRAIGARRTAAAERRASEWRDNARPIYQEVHIDVRAESSVAVQEAFKQAQRLAMLAAGRDVRAPQGAWGGHIPGAWKPIG